MLSHLADPSRIFLKVHNASSLLGLSHKCYTLNWHENVSALIEDSNKDLMDPTSCALHGTQEHFKELQGRFFSTLRNS